MVRRRQAYFDAESTGSVMRVETPEYAAFCRRIIRAYSRRVAEADEVEAGHAALLRSDSPPAAVAVRTSATAYAFWQATFCGSS